MRNQLENEIQNLLTLMDGMDRTSEEYKTVVARIGELMKIKNQEMEALDSYDLKRLELRLKTQEFEHKKKIDLKTILINAGIGVAGIVLPMIFNGIWYERGLKFEETGSYTSTIFREIRNKNKK